MSKKLVLHIGMQKTGTSSIQLMLHSSPDALRSQGYIFPELPQVGKTDIWRTAFRHNLLAASFADFPSAFETYSPEQIEELRQALLATPYTPILSAEDFSRQKDFSRLAPFFDGFSIDVIVYLRRLDKFAESLYNQRNKILLSRKSPLLLDPDLATEAGMMKFLQKEGYLRLLDYKSLIERISGALDVKTLIVREYERESLLNRNVCCDFAAALNLQTESMTLPATEANTNVSNKHFMNLRNMFVSSGEDRALALLEALHNRFMRGDDLSGNYNLLTAESRRAFLRAYSGKNRWVSQEFGVFQG